VAVVESAIVSNHTSAAMPLLVYAVDGSMSKQGAFLLAAQEDPRQQVGGWTKVGQTQITVPANSELKVPFEVTVPVGTPPGDYVGGLVIQSAPVAGAVSQSANGTAVRMDIVKRSGVRVYLTVAGSALTKLSPGDLRWERTGDTISVYLPLRNSGNVTMHPTGTFTLKRPVGSRTEVRLDAPESILPGQDFTLTGSFRASPTVEIGDGTVIIKSEAPTLTVATKVVSITWWVIVSALVVLVLLGAALWRTARFVRQARSAIAEVRGTRRILQSQTITTGVPVRNGGGRHAAPVLDGDDSSGRQADKRAGP
jgi:hypothetical protein